MGPRAYWIALAIVLFYVIARPHIGTVWYVNADYAGPTDVASASPTPANPLIQYATPSSRLLSDETPTPTAAPGFRPDPPKTHFSDRRDCLDAAVQFERQARLTGAYCASESALLWGW
jgi:hypothetical protein